MSQTFYESWFSIFCNPQPYNIIQLLMKQTLYCLFALLWTGFRSQAQTTPQPTFDRSQFSIMVVPYLKSTDAQGSIIQTIESSPVIRNAISLINKALLNADYQVKDFVEAYELQMRDKLIDGSERDLPEIIIKNAPVDVWIKFEMELRRCNNPGECDMRVRLQAVDKYDAHIYADCLLSSQCRRSCDSSVLLNNVLEVQEGGAASCVATQFDREYRKVLERNGRVMEFQTCVKEGSSRRLDEDCDKNGNQVHDCVETLAKQLAKNGDGKVIGKTPKCLRMQLRLPLVDGDGSTFNASSLAKKLRQKILLMTPDKGKFGVEEVVIGSRVTLTLMETP
jgi:hypothetical protein